MLWDSVEGALSLPQDKLQHPRSQAAFLLDKPTPTCRQVMVLTGLVAAFHKAVPLLRLKGSFIQLSLNSSYSSAADLLKTVVLLPEARCDLLWMTRLQLADCHGPLWPLMAEDCAIEVQTDASGRGYGVWFQGRLSGEWDNTAILTRVVWPVDRPTSGFFQVFEKSRQILKKAGKFFEKSQPAGFFQDFANCPNPDSDTYQVSSILM
jgi:hypothetical protein